MEEFFTYIGIPVLLIVFIAINIYSHKKTNEDRYDDYFDERNNHF